MPFIKTIAYDDAQGDLKAVYEEIVDKFSGRLANVLQVVGLHPGALRSLRDRNHAVTCGGSGLGRRREEMIATLVSVRNDCPY